VRGLDTKDLSILEILESNARIPWRRLASILGVSEATVYLRIRRLEESGILRGFTAIIDPASLGLSTTLFVLLKVKPGSLSGVRERLAEMPFTLEVYEVTGDYQLLVKIVAPSHGEAARALEALASLEGVSDYATIASLQTIKGGTGIVRVYKYWLGGSGSASESPRPRAGREA
jgi:Lrp/AsnC family transcriptional regulator for asnA, asnC and gidA